MKLRPWALPVLTLVIANIYALAGVARDRAGSPETAVTLSDRELRQESTDDENSGTLLGWSWRSSDRDSLTRSRVEALGFRCDREIDPCRHDWNDLRGYALVGLDLEGWAKDTLRALHTLDSLRHATMADSTRHRRMRYAESALRDARNASRLTVYEVARSADELRPKAVPGQFILPATLSISYSSRRDRDDSTRFSLYANLTPGALFVPTAIAAGFKGRPARRMYDSDGAGYVHYEATVVIGAAGLARITGITWPVDATKEPAPKDDSTGSLEPPEN